MSECGEMWEREKSHPLSATPDRLSSVADLSL